MDPDIPFTGECICVSILIQISTKIKFYHLVQTLYLFEKVSNRIKPKDSQNFDNSKLYQLCVYRFLKES